MTICLKDHQTHHILALPEHLKGISEIPIPDLLMMKAMAMTMMVTTRTQAQFICQYLNQDPNLKLILKTWAKYSPRPSLNLRNT